mmetsp:Transcript_6374/g.9807  ORF Transcript_6374/g.9807 Transcript_6374/m.9807 type:complete len:148 (+) Transcript_6374:738-1181(+)
MRPAKRSDESEYYECILLYTDDALVVSENAESVLRNELGGYFELKQESIRVPKIYLGGSVRKVELENGVEAWAFGSSQYVQAAVKNVQTLLQKDHNACWKDGVLTSPDSPLPTSYRPELDISPELKTTKAAYYQSLIGVLRWMVELG